MSRRRRRWPGAGGMALSSSCATRLRPTAPTWWNPRSLTPATGATRDGGPCGPAPRTPCPTEPRCDA
jgi:hypothetical protein